MKALSFAVERKFAQSVLNSTVKTAFLTQAKSFKIYILMWTLVLLGHLLPHKFREGRLFRQFSGKVLNALPLVPWYSHTHLPVSRRRDKE